MKKALHTNHAHPREDMDCRRRPREVCRKGIYMKITRPIRAVLFDMDGVMVDSEFVYMKYLLEFAKEKNPAVTMEDITPMVGRSRQDSWTVMERAVNNGETWETLIKEWAERDIYSRIDYRKIFRPEMKTTVQELKRRGYTVTLVSSTGPKLISRIVEEVGICLLYTSPSPRDA